MNAGHTVETLIAFEREIADLFNAGSIPYPVHLSGGNERQLIDVFKDIKPEDYVCTNWRSHYHCLLKGVPPAKLKQSIVDGHSITLNFPKHRIVSSAIVGGILPISLGIAWQIRRSGGNESVHCFLGDMTRTTGMFAECLSYAQNFDLPIEYIVEDNGKSVMTPTAVVTGWDLFGWGEDKDREYDYELTWPHSGAGKRVEF